jgi:hypothetical protein
MWYRPRDRDSVRIASPAIVKRGFMGYQYYKRLTCKSVRLLRSHQQRLLSMDYWILPLADNGFRQRSVVAGRARRGLDLTAADLGRK